MIAVSCTGFETSFHCLLPGMRTAAEPLSALSSVESYDEPAKEWGLERPLPSSGYGMGIVQLPSGLVLVTGGSNSDGSVDSTYLYDPMQNEWSTTENLHTPRFSHTTTLLENGDVLVVGGNNLQPPHNGQVQDSVEIYRQETGRWRKATWLPYDCMSHTATRLLNGQILVVGGYSGQENRALSQATLYDPKTDKWTAVEPLPKPRLQHTATLLKDGRVLVCCGEEEPFGIGQTMGFIYDPELNTWGQTRMAMPHESATATLLHTGEVLVCGTANPGGPRVEPELFVPTTGRWLSAGPMQEDRFSHTATCLPSGRVLVAGGLMPVSHPVVLKSAELYSRGD
jgi:hypothetical protein